MCCWNAGIYFLLLLTRVDFFRIYFLESRKFLNYFYFLQSRILGRYLYFLRSNNWQSHLLLTTLFTIYAAWLWCLKFDTIMHKISVGME